jgi:hypothetical protein
MLKEVARYACQSIMRPYIIKTQESEPELEVYYSIHSQFLGQVRTPRILHCTQGNKIKDKINEQYWPSSETHERWVSGLRFCDIQCLFSPVLARCSRDILEDILELGVAAYF